MDRTAVNLRQQIAVYIAAMRERTAELNHLANHPDLTIDELRDMIRDTAGRLADLAYLAERVTPFEVESAFTRRSRVNAAQARV